MVAAKRIDLKPDTDLQAVVEAVHADKQPRVIARGREELAVIVSTSDFERAAAVDAPASRRRKTALKSFAGIWRDLDAERLIDYVREGRRLSPPSPRVEL
ncbi:MAG TPA: hypothetical protein VFX49_15360 [Chloroflexota bacterium]|nr:hypothetical protein [Chloroflexota bacterium]